MKYGLITGWKVSEFEQDVNKALERGWQLQGGVSIAVDSQNGNRTFAQAIITTQDEDEEGGE